MVFNYFTISSLINAVTSFSFCFFVFFKNPKSKLNRSFAFFAFSVGFWAINHFFAFSIQNETSALFFHRVLMAGAMFIPTTFFHFVCLFLDIYDRKKLLIKAGYIASLVFLLSDFTPLFIPSVSKKLSFEYFENFGPMYHPFLVMFAGFTLYSHYLMFRGFQSNRGSRRNQIKYVFAGTLIGFIGGSTSFFLVYNIPIPPVGNSLVTVYIIMVAIAIIRHRLLDITIALTRAGIFVLVYLFVLGIPFVLGYKYGLWQLATWVTVVLATAGPSIYLFLQSRAEKIIRKEQLDYQKALRNTSSTMMLNKNLDKLLSAIVLNVVDIVKVEWAAIYLKDEKASKYLIRHKRSRIKEINLPIESTFDSALVKRLYASKLPLIGEEIHSNDLKAGLAVPCFLDSNMVGFLLLGDKPKGQIYDQSDVNEFTLLSNQIALAIENCQFYSQERQGEHFRRIASLDRQIDGMAHEMDNPIHAILSVSGNIDIVLDELKGTIPPDNMDYLKQKLSRIEFNALRLSKMISSVKEFTKPTTGEFTPIPLQQIVDSFVAIINPQVHYYGVNFNLDLPSEPVWLRANKVEIEQVLVNLGTNSVQAIRDMPKENKKEISLKAYKKDDSVLRIDFSDTGSGIEEKLIEDIFLDFVTTKPGEGTGLGLAISRKTIHRHNGKIWAESEGRGRGAAFHIELPIANDISEEEKIKFNNEQNEEREKYII